MTEAPKPPDKHHYIPRFHLSKWTDHTGQLFRYTQPHIDVVVRRAFVGEAGFENGLYNSETGLDGKVISLEKEFFSKIDDRAAKAVQEILAERSLSPEQVTTFVIYLRSLMHRTPIDLENFKVAAQQNIVSSLAKLQTEYSFLRSESDPQNFDDFLKQSDPFSNDQMIVSSLPKIILNPKIISYMVAFQWYLIDVSQASYRLLISDNPICMTNGLAKPMGHIALPLSPTFLVLGAPELATITTLRQLTPNQIVKALNEQTVKGARNFVGAIDESQNNYIRKRFNTAPRRVLVADLADRQRSE